MKSWLTTLKKTGIFLIGFVTLGLPIFVLVMQIHNIRGDYDDLVAWLPIHPFAVIISQLLPYFALLSLFFFLYKKRTTVGKLKTLGFVFIALLLLILSQLSFSFYIINYR